MGNIQSLSVNPSVGRKQRSLSLRSSRATDANDEKTAKDGSTKGSEDESETWADAIDGAAASLGEDGSDVEGSEDELTRLQNKLLMAENTSSTDEEDASEGSLSALDRLLLKQRRERMMELKNIQDKNKRVSDGRNCRRLERFFTRALTGDNQSETGSVSSDTSDSTTSTTGRTESVVLEVRGLFQTQPVTSALQRNNFRSQLETIIRGNLIRQEREMETALRLQNAGLPGHAAGGRSLTDGFVAHQLHEESSTVSSSTHSSGNIHPSNPSIFSPGQGVPPPPPPPPPGMVNQFMPIPMQYQPPQMQQHHMRPPVQIQSPTVAEAQDRSPTQVGPPPMQRLQQLNSGGMAPQLPWLLNRQEGLQDDIQMQIRAHHQEALISEISNLVHSQLVTSTLESNFRGELEVMMQNRLSQSGSGGEQVMNIVQNLPRDASIVRNDFSHLGIRGPQGQRSQGNPRPTEGPQMSFVPSNAWGQEMASLREQVAELQNMVKISFDLQLDLQRAIRQEVAAALSNANGGGAASATAAPGREVHPAREGHCIICLDKSIDAVLYQCGHMCVCLACGLRLKDLGSHCPMCRAPIRDVIRAFKCHEK